MTRSFVFARLPVHTVAARDELLAIAAPITEHARASEPGVTKYAAFVAHDDPSNDDLAVYMMEEYADTAAFEAHVATEGVKKFVAWLGAAGNTDGTPHVRFTVHTELEHVTEAAIGTTDPYVVVSTFTFPGGGAAAALEQFKESFSEGKKRGALLYGVYTDKDSADVVLTAEAHGSAEAYGGPAVAGSVEKTTVLTLKHGYLHK